jgi:hypothetical protein
MNQIFTLIISFILIQHLSFSQNLLLWNGENIDVKSCILGNGEIDSTQSFEGKYCFKAQPDQWHQSTINLNCQGTWRIDISNMQEIHFQIKSNKINVSTKFGVSGWPYTSKLIDLSQFIEKKSISTEYRKVKIPIDSIKTKDYNLSSIEFLIFDVSTDPELQFFIDDFWAIDTKPNKINQIEFTSNQAIKLQLNESYDTTDVLIPQHYTVKSNSDATFKNGKNPIKIGKHYFVNGFSKVGPNPNVTYELFLFFDFPLQNNTNYELSISSIKDRAGNNYLDTLKYIFNFLDSSIINHSVKVNHVGYLPEGPKLAYIGNYLGGAGLLELNPTQFEIRSTSNNKLVFTGKPIFIAKDSILSGEKIYLCDFTNFKDSGSYYIYVPGIGRSYDFDISKNVFDSVYYHTARSLYYQRCGTALETPFADSKFTHSICHSDDGYSHSSWLKSPLYNNEPINYKFNTTRGWHDAGDYGKYVCTAVGAIHTLLKSYELFPEKFADNELNIPESGNKVPDILDEVKWEIDWLQTMQQPDGGVCDRVVTESWAHCLPNEDIEKRDIAEKTTFATAQYAAALAMAYRSFKPFWPNYADSCLSNAKKAMQFLINHPVEEPNGGYINADGIGGGGYTDNGGDSDDRAWAAAELYKSTGLSFYDSIFSIHWKKYSPFFGYWNPWQFHQINASFAYASTKFSVDSIKIEAIKKDFLVNYIQLVLTPQLESNFYKNAFRSDVKAWIGWGSFAQSTKYSWDYIMAYYFTKDSSYLNQAKLNLNTQLGLNPQDRSYITGIGEFSPKDPLQMQCITDSIPDPIPGIPVFGPMCAMSKGNPYDAAVQHPQNLYPRGDDSDTPYPILRRYYDINQNVAMSEFSIELIALTSSVFAFFKDKPLQKINQDTTKTTELTSLINEEITIYPNPTNEILYCKFKNPSLNRKIIIYTLNGEKILEEKVNQSLNTLSLQGLSNGLYFYKIEEENQLSVSEKLIIVN